MVKYAHISGDCGLAKVTSHHLILTSNQSTEQLPLYKKVIRGDGRGVKHLVDTLVVW